jgi:hypothetical protein
MMPQSLALVLVHIIFSTKNQMAFLQSAELRSEVHAYLTGTLRGRKQRRRSDPALPKEAKARPWHW